MHYDTQYLAHYQVLYCSRPLYHSHYCTHYRTPYRAHYCPYYCTHYQG